MTAIRKHLVDFLAILGLIVVALAVASVILANQRLALPGWMPVLGQDFTEVEAELSSAQAVTPGQGQTVNVAGVEVGEISRRAARGRQGDRHAEARGGLGPGLQGRERAAAAQDRPEGHGRRAHAGHARRPASSRRASGSRSARRCRTSTSTRSSPRSTATRAPTCSCCCPTAAQALGGNGRALANTIRRFEPTARDTRKIAEQLATRRAEHQARHPQLLAASSTSWAARTTSSPSSWRTPTRCSPRSPARTRTCARRCRSCRRRSTRRRARSARRKTLADELGPTLEALRPGRARARPGARRRRARSCARRRRSSSDEIRPFVRASRPGGQGAAPGAARPLRRSRPTCCARSRSSTGCSTRSPTTRPATRDEGFLFWASWVNHLGPAIFSNQDAQGPIRRGLVVIGCQSLQILENIVLGNPQLGVLIAAARGARPARRLPAVRRSRRAPARRRGRRG